MILFCGCRSTSPAGIKANHPIPLSQSTLGAEFQDKLYGKGYRVHNPIKVNPPSSPAQYRCTVCCKTRPISNYVATVQVAKDDKKSKKDKDQEKGTRKPQPLNVQSQQKPETPKTNKGSKERKSANRK